MNAQQMFENPFGFHGRVRRREFGLSWLVAIGYIAVVETLGRRLLSLENMEPFFLICGLIPALFFFLTQSVKRCHDLGYSGWLLLIPLIFFVLVFIEGKPGGNQYGPNPKSGVWPGMSVRIIPSPPEEFRTEKYTLEWDEKMNTYLGGISEVLEMDEDGDFKLKIDNGENTWAKAWVTPY